MKSYKSIAAMSVLAFAGVVSVSSAAAQTAVSSPIVVQQIPTSQKPIWLKAEVIRFDSNSITVREAADERMIHTFTYAPTAQAAVQKALNTGGYQYGDKVKIRYKQGQTVALAIHGKASKPSTSTPAPVAPIRPATPR
jgi:hypothetical protein